MPRQLRLEIPDTLYHITMRGNAQQDIVTSDSERALFIDMLGETVYRSGWTCHSYCLMNNHYHLVIQIEEQNLSEGMQWLNGRFASTVNSRKRRCGHLFESRFHSKVIDTDEYYYMVACYIVLNPVRAFVVNHPCLWKWSSYQKTAFGGEHPAFLDVEALLSMFGDEIAQAREAYIGFIDGWLESDVEAIQAANDLSTKRLDLAEIFRNRPGARNTLIEEAYFVHAYRIREIAEYCGLSKSVVGRIIKKSSARGTKSGTVPDPYVGVRSDSL